MNPSHSVLRTIACLGLCSAALLASAQLSTFAGNDQHTNMYSVPAGNMNRVLWQTPIDTTNSGIFAHYGEPLITPSNTVIVPVLTSSSNVTINAYDGATGNFKYNLTTDYVLPAHDWIPEYTPTLAGTRLYYPGNGGTVYYVDNVDGTPTTPTQVCFYGLSTYQANEAGYNGTVFIDTPLTSDSHGNIFFGFRMQGTPIAPFTANGNGQPVSGYARIGADGSTTYVMVNTMTTDSTIAFDSHNAAPALSNDESTLYVVAKAYNTPYYAYICGLDSTTLATKYKRFITDPRPGGSAAGPIDDSTASPMVAPDGDVYMGMFVTPYNGSRGYLAHYNSDLSVVKTPGAFGWDFTPGIVPASMVPSYHGHSSYLLFCKYNNYGDTGQDDGGDEINTVAILDPNDETQIDWHPMAAGMVEMREVLTMIGATPNNETTNLPNSVREWCVNATAVNPATDSVFFNSEDGKAYRWNLTQNSLAQCITLTTGFGVPYVPSFIGPDGTVYTFNGTYLFAIAPVPGTVLTLDSDHPDARTTVLGDNVTFIAHVTGGGSAATGNVTFSDTTYDNYTPVTTVLGTAPVINQQAVLSTSTLNAGSYNSGADIYLGNHFITASYSGDGNHPAATIMRVQKVHWYPSTTSLQLVPNTVTLGQSIQLNASVAGPAGSGVPTAMITFTDGPRVIGQQRLDSNGNATMVASGLAAGNHNFTATYVGDTEFASSAASAQGTVQGGGTSTALSSSANPSPWGQSVTFTAAVTPSSGGGVPTGSVTFFDGGVAMGTSNVDASGNAVISISTLAVGQQDITATFNPVGVWNPSTSPILSEMITEGSQTSVSADINPAAYGQTVTFTVVVFAPNGGAGVPQGDVTLLDGSTALATLPMRQARNDLEFTINTLSAGSHNITAAFTGQNGWQSSASAIYVETITDGTTLAVSGSPNPSNYSVPVTFTATVSPADTNAGTPSGNVTFSDGANVMGTAPVDATGHATFTTSSLTVGNHTINVAFNSSQGWGSSNSQTGQMVQAPTNTTVIGAPNPSNFGQSVTFTATVASNNPAAGTPVGSVSFSDGNNPLGTVPLDASGHATLSTNTLTFGSHTINVTFNPTPGWLISGNQTTQSVQDDTVTTVASSLNPSTVGQSVTLTATVRAADAGAGTPVGNVTFFDGATNLGNQPVDGTGHASINTSTLAVGTHSITASFVGVPGWHNSASSALSQVVNGDTTPPSIPTGVSATSGPAKGQVTVRWTASTDPDDAVDHYEIWRSNKATTGFTLLTTVTGTSYVDNAGKQTRYYNIVAVDTHGNKSGHSVTVSAKGL